jgi:hypothetical protein
LIGGTLAQLATAPLRLPFFVYLALLCTVARTNFFCAGDGGQEETIERSVAETPPPRSAANPFAVRFSRRHRLRHFRRIPFGAHSELLRDSLHQAAPGGTCCRGRHCL